MLGLCYSRHSGHHKRECIVGRTREVATEADLDSICSILPLVEGLPIRFSAHPPVKHLAHIGRYSSRSKRV